MTCDVRYGKTTFPPIIPLIEFVNYIWIYLTINIKNSVFLNYVISFSIFGSKQASTLRKITQEKLTQEDLTELGIKSGLPPDVTLTGS